MCRELKRAKKLIIPGETKELLNLEKTTNELPISIDHESEIKALYLDFIFKERDKTS